MFKYKTVKEQMLEERKKNAQLSAENIKIRSDVDFVAMMCDIELDNDTPIEEGENNG